MRTANKRSGVKLAAVSFAAAAISVTAGPAVVTVPAQPSTQERISFAGGRVSFVPPPGFTPLTNEEMLGKFNRSGATPPKAAVGNASRSVTIAFGLTGQQVPANDLVKVQQVITDAYNGAGFVSRWIKNEIVELGGMRWVFFDVVTRAADTEVHNQALFGVLDLQLVAFNFNATVAEFSKVEGEMAKARQSIRVVNPPAP